MDAMDAFSGLPEACQARLRVLYGEPHASVNDLASSITDYLQRLERAALRHEFVDLDTARQVAQLCTELLQQLGSSSAETRRQVVQMAIHYFVLEHDAEGDVTSMVGLDDDLRVAQAAHRYLTERSPDV